MYWQSITLPQSRTKDDVCCDASNFKNIEAKFGLSAYVQCHINSGPSSRLAASCRITMLLFVIVRSRAAQPLTET